VGHLLLCRFLDADQLAGLPSQDVVNILFFEENLHPLLVEAVLAVVVALVVLDCELSRIGCYCVEFGQLGN
jgi:hypothetical protein